ncbi:MAG: hypothetical protein N4A50_05680 [Vallitalea sp.]|jgi:hypothetical protein|nr:hypothetical protein [Vallitalea sp.]
MYKRDNIYYNIFGQIEINSIIEQKETILREEYINLNKNANVSKTNKSIKRRR